MEVESLYSSTSPIGDLYMLKVKLNPLEQELLDRYDPRKGGGINLGGSSSPLPIGGGGSGFKKSDPLGTGNCNNNIFQDLNLGEGVDLRMRYDFQQGQAPSLDLNLFGQQQKEDPNNRDGYKLPKTPSQQNPASPNYINPTRLGQLEKKFPQLGNIGKYPVNHNNILFQGDEDK